MELEKVVVLVHHWLKEHGLSRTCCTLEEEYGSSVKVQTPSLSLGNILQSIDVFLQVYTLKNLSINMEEMKKRKRTVQRSDDRKPKPKGKNKGIEKETKCDGKEENSPEYTTINTILDRSPSEISTDPPFNSNVSNNVKSPTDITTSKNKTVDGARDGEGSQSVETEEINDDDNIPWICPNMEEVLEKVYERTILSMDTNSVVTGEKKKESRKRRRKKHVSAITANSSGYGVVASVVSLSDGNSAKDSESWFMDTRGEHQSAPPTSDVPATAISSETTSSDCNTVTNATDVSRIDVSKIKIEISDDDEEEENENEVRKMVPDTPSLQDMEKMLQTMDESNIEDENTVSKENTSNDKRSGLTASNSIKKMKSMKRKVECGTEDHLRSTAESKPLKDPIGIHNKCTKAMTYKCAEESESQDSIGDFKSPRKRSKSVCSDSSRRSKDSRISPASNKKDAVKLFVGHLPDKVGAEDVHDYFRSFVESVLTVSNPTRNFCFVTLSSKDADYMIENSNHQILYWKGRRLVCEMAHEKSLNNTASSGKGNINNNNTLHSSATISKL